jgi:hypothetical protein
VAIQPAFYQTKELSVKNFKLIFLSFATVTISFAAEIKVVESQPGFAEYKSWYETSETADQIEESKRLSMLEKGMMRTELSLRKQLVRDLINYSSLRNVKEIRNITLKAKKDFESYEALENIYLKPFIEGIENLENNVLDFDEFLKNFQERLSYKEIRDHLGTVNVSDYSLVLLRDIRKFLYALYNEVEAAIKKNENTKPQNSWLVLKEKILSLLESVDILSIHWFKKRYPSFDIAILEKDVKTNNEEKRRLARLQTEFIDLQKKYEENIQTEKKLEQKREAALKITNEKVKGERLEKLGQEFKNLEKAKKETKLKGENLEFLLQEFTGTLPNKKNRYKKDYPTLFEKLLRDEYEKEMVIGSGNYYLPHQAYQALGLQYWATPKEVEDAYYKRRNSLENATTQIERQKWQGARNASTILGGKEGKQTYDIFLDDFLILLRLGIDPYFKIKSKVLQNFLNTEGQLSRIEISAEVQDEIHPHNNNSMSQNNNNSMSQKVIDLYAAVVKYNNEILKSSTQQK